MIGTDPFSLVVVIGVHFMPKIELSFGFTLSGIGGLLAIERRLDSDALRRGIREGAVKTRHLRALQRFRELLSPERPGDES